MSRVDLIRQSLRCFVLGLLGLVPVIGIPASSMAVVQYIHVMRHRSAEWNPAERYLNWGFFFGLFGLVLTFIACALIGLAIVQSVTSH